jgi:diaminopropionate ammonia-lyase
MRDPLTEAGHWYSRPPARDWRCEAPGEGPSLFHAGLPGYQPTGLVEAPELAAELGVGRVFVKDESGRLGLAAFKVLGASWAVARLLASEGTPSVEDLRRIAAESPVELVTATDGNHGRALAFIGRLLGLPVRVFVPDGTSAAVIAVIAAEGAMVTEATVPYDGAVTLAASYTAALAGRVLVQDTAWPGYERVPGLIVDGYDTLLREVDAQLTGLGAGGPDLVAVPVGVGSLAQAVVTHYRSSEAARPAVLAVEPAAAPCLITSLLAGELRSVPTEPTMMAGLVCGTASSLAWPVLAAGLDAAVAVPDEAARRAVADLAAAKVQAGPSGAASLAGARAALTGDGAAERRADLGVTESSALVLLSTEGNVFGEGASDG